MKSPCNKAQEVFTRVLLKYGLGCKLLSLNEADKSDISSVKWDATMSTKENIGDRHQMGKELCVYMHFDSQANTYQFQPEEYKAMMLDLWAELQKTGVSIGYSGTPLGDRAVPAEEGLATPFSYAAFRPFINRYGILLQDKYNPYEFEDPLQGVVIGLEDLIEAGIDIVAMRQMQQNRLNWLSQHIEKAEQSIRDEISQGDSNNVSKFLDYLEQMDKLEGNQLKGFLRDKQSELNEFVYLRCPRQFSNRIELARTA